MKKIYINVFLETGIWQSANFVFDCSGVCSLVPLSRCQLQCACWVSLIGPFSFSPFHCKLTTLSATNTEEKDRNDKGLGCCHY